MVQEKIYNMSFEKVYTLLIQKVQRKGKSKNSFAFALCFIKQEGGNRE